MIHSSDDDQAPEYQQATAICRRLTRFRWLTGPAIIVGFALSPWGPILAPGADNWFMRGSIMWTAGALIALGAFVGGATTGVAYVLRLWAISHERPLRARGPR